MSNKGILVVLSGFSGSGKGTLVKRLLEEYDNYALSISMTTRMPRPGEVHGKSYFFVTQEEFKSTIDRDGLLEYARYCDNFYGTPKKQVMDWMDEGINVILEIDVQGALQIKKSYPEGIFIFILPPSIEELKNRILGRGSETEETMARRLGAALKEISSIDEYDYRVVNEDLQEAVDRVKAIISAEHSKINDEEVERIINRYKEEL